MPPNEEMSDLDRGLDTLFSTVHDLLEQVPPGQMTCADQVHPPMRSVSVLPRGTDGVFKVVYHIFPVAAPDQPPIEWARFTFMLPHWKSPDPVIIEHRLRAEHQDEVAVWRFVLHTEEKGRLPQSRAWRMAMFIQCRIIERDWMAACLTETLARFCAPDRA